MDMEPGEGTLFKGFPPPSSFPPKLFDCIESLFAAFPFCQGTGRGVFSWKQKGC